MMCFSAWLCFARDSLIDRIDHTLDLTHTTLHTRTLTNKVLFRGWLKIIKGSASLQTDVGVNPIWTRAMTSKAKDGWCVVGGGGGARLQIMHFALCACICFLAELPLC